MQHLLKKSHFFIVLACIGVGLTTNAGTTVDAKLLTKSEHQPTHVIEKAPGHFFVAFERAAFGTVKITFDSPADGHAVEVHFGERASGENTVNRKPGGTIRYRMAPVALKKGKHEIRVAIPPDGRNTGGAAIKMPKAIGEVIPFRYVEIINSPSEITADNIRQIAVHVPFDEDASDFTCSDKTLNAVWDLCKYSIKATSFCGIYVDGDRERIPYEADAYINQLCHYGVDQHYAMGRRSHEYLIKHPTWPTEWILHSPLMAWADYEYTGETESMARCYEDLKAKTLMALSREDGLISTHGGRVTKQVQKSIHLGRTPRDIVDWPKNERDGYDFKPFNTVVNAFHYRSVILMAQMAELLGHDEDAKLFATQAGKVHESFNRVFFDPKHKLYIDGEGSTHASLHANMFAVALGLVPDDRMPAVVKHIKSKGMACSVYGAQYLLEALYMAGEAQAALDLMTAKHERGWWNMIKAGSTITLEAWDIKFKGNLDWNHAWGAAPANIIPRFLVGVRPLEPGFSQILIQPQPGNLESVKAKVPTPKGPVLVDIKNPKNGPFELTVTIPTGTAARVEMPNGTTTSVKSGTHQLSCKP